MRKTPFLIAAVALPLAACATYSSPYGYDNYGYRSSYYNPVTSVIGALSGAYSPYGYGYGGFSQAAASACANVASRYGPVRVTSVRQTSSSRVKVYGYAQRGYRTDNWDCTFRSDGRITDFDI